MVTRWSQGGHKVVTRLSTGGHKVVTTAVNFNMQDQGSVGICIALLLDNTDPDGCQGCI